MLERELAEARKANAKLLRMVEMVMEERFYRPTITGGDHENRQSPGLPIDTLNDVAVFDEGEDAAQMRQELQEIENEHLSWRSGKGISHEDEAATAA